ncbi:hypothetical protein ABQE48_22830, partial [Mycolicibacterium thermoresistibile]
PRDEVPDPSTEDGKLFQEIARAQDMATTIREVSETTDRYGNAVTTFHMVDGSEHIRTDWIDQGLPSQQIHPAGTIQILHVDKNKNWISDTTSMAPRGRGESHHGVVGRWDNNRYLTEPRRNAYW